MRSGWPTTDAVLDDEGSLRLGPRNDVRLASFASVDLHVARRFAIGAGELTVFLDVINATNRDNPCCVGFDVDDEVVPARVVRELDSWPPLVPSLGFRLRF